MPELSALRLVKVPDAAPPYDCQVHGAGCPAHAALPVPAAAPSQAAVPAVPWPAVPGAAVPGPGAAAAWPRQLAVVIVEVLAGVRPERQLVPLASDRVRARVAGLAPYLTCPRRPRIQRIVTSRPAATVVETTVVASFGPRSRALALRFEHVPARPAAPGWPARPARWLCTAIEAG